MSLSMIKPNKFSLSLNFTELKVLASVFDLFEDGYILEKVSESTYGSTYILEFSKQGEHND